MKKKEYQLFDIQTRQSHICIDMNEKGFSVISMRAWMKETDLKVSSAAFFNTACKVLFCLLFFLAYQYVFQRFFYFYV